MIMRRLTRRALGQLAAGSALSVAGLVGVTRSDASIKTANAAGRNPDGSLRRYVVGTDVNGQSYTQFSGLVTAGGPALPGGDLVAALWATHQMPVDNSGTVDERSTGHGPSVGPDGTSFGFVYHPAGQPATPAVMHRTATTDYWAVLAGEATLVTNTDQIHLRAGDTIVVRGANHGWAHPAGQPFLGVSVSLDAIPTDRSPATGQGAS